MYKCPACNISFHIKDIVGGVCSACDEKGFWMDPAGGLQFDEPGSDEFSDPAAMYE